MKNILFALCLISSFLSFTSCNECDQVIYDNIAGKATDRNTNKVVEDVRIAIGIHAEQTTREVFTNNLGKFSHTDDDCRSLFMGEDFLYIKDVSHPDYSSYTLSHHKGTDIEIQLFN